MSAIDIVLCVGLALSLLGMFTTNQVADWLRPKSESPLAFITVLLSVMWFALGKVFCFIGVLIFALGLAIVH